MNICIQNEQKYVYENEEKYCVLFIFFNIFWIFLEIFNKS